VLIVAAGQRLQIPTDLQGCRRQLPDGRKQLYKLHLPKGIPAENFWAVTLYDAPTAAGVDKPGQPIPSVSSQQKPKYNDDGSIDLYFGPEMPQGAPNSNYLGTNKGKGFFVVIRLYSPGQAYFDKTWKPDDLVKLN
jgi:hypothetical protein